jgi:hypothetical protein
VRRSWQVSNSRANRAPRWDSKSQINKAVQYPVRQDGEHQLFFSFENPLKNAEQEKELEEHLDPVEVIFRGTRGYQDGFASLRGEELSKNHNLPAGPTAKFNVRGFALRAAPPIQMMTNKARLANRFSTSSRSVRGCKQRRKS